MRSQMSTLAVSSLLLLGACTEDALPPSQDAPITTAQAEQGADGQNGAPGQDGAAGAQGEPGANGRDGADGRDGTNGTDGINGQDGADGKDGTDFFNLPVFDIVEADVAMVHAALAGEYKLAEGTDKLTCETLVKMHIERIFMYNDNPQPNGGLPISSVLAINPEVLNQAKELDARYERDGGIGERYLHCAPVLLKDNYDTFDHASTSASPSMFGHQAGADAPSVKGLRDAGAIILGKAHQDEFAYFTMGLSGRNAIVTNPYNTQESPAGSSSGTGASIAASFGLLGTGSDTCQSIRHPSSVGGLVGIRPSIGVVSRKGIFPLLHVRDTGGPMTRNVRDTALMLTAMATYPQDTQSIYYVDEPEALKYKEFVETNDYLDDNGYLKFLDTAQFGLSGRKIGVVRRLGDLGSAAAQNTTQGDLIEAAVQKMESLGAEVYTVDLPDFTNRSAGSTHYDVNQYFVEFFRDGGTSPRRCLSSSLIGEAHGDILNCSDPTTGVVHGIFESMRTAP
ncbi:MAG: amidase family protein, partial [Limnobacter sp.]|nr:amidase family protein [Limnobacter sp.]